MLLIAWTWKGDKKICNCNPDFLKLEGEKIYSNFKPETVRSNMSTQARLQLLDPQKHGVPLQLFW